MSHLKLSAYFRLIRFDWYLARGDFAALHRRVRGQPVCDQTKGTPSAEEICRAVDFASIWYWKRVLCLQRSATTASLLKDYGLRAEMVIGAQQIPFKAHAWVEVGGQVVNDTAYTAELYSVLDRC